MLLLQGKKIKCSASQAKHRLFIGNVPRKWTEEDLKKIVADVGPGVTGVELLKVIFFFFETIASCLSILDSDNVFDEGL